MLDRQTHQQVATFHGRLEADEYARHLARLGQFYDNAVVAVEVNGYGWVVLNVLRKFYSNLFHHLHYDRETVTPRDGWHTNVATKPELVADLVAAVRDEMLVIPCEHNRRDSELGVA